MSGWLWGKKDKKDNKDKMNKNDEYAGRYQTSEASGKICETCGVRFYTSSRHQTPFENRLMCGTCREELMSPAPEDNLGRAGKNKGQQSPDRQGTQEANKAKAEVHRSSAETGKSRENQQKSSKPEKGFNQESDRQGQYGTRADGRPVDFGRKSGGKDQEKEDKDDEEDQELLKEIEDQLGKTWVAMEKVKTEIDKFTGSERKYNSLRTSMERHISSLEKIKLTVKSKRIKNDVQTGIDIAQQWLKELIKKFQYYNSKEYLAEQKIKKVEDIQRKTVELEREIEAFVGTKQDTRYFYLDESLIRNVIELDRIDVEEDSFLKNKRRDLIKKIHDASDKLEKRVSRKIKNEEAAALDDGHKSVNDGQEKPEKLEEKTSVEKMDTDNDPNAQKQAGSIPSAKEEKTGNFGGTKKGTKDVTEVHRSADDPMDVDDENNDRASIEPNQQQGRNNPNDQWGNYGRVPNPTINPGSQSGNHHHHGGTQHMVVSLEQQGRRNSDEQWENSERGTTTQSEVPNRTINPDGQSGSYQPHIAVPNEQQGGSNPAGQRGNYGWGSGIPNPTSNPGSQSGNHWYQGETQQVVVPPEQQGRSNPDDQWGNNRREATSHVGILNRTSNHGQSGNYPHGGTTYAMAAKRTSVTGFNKMSSELGEITNEIDRFSRNNNIYKTLDELVDKLDRVVAISKERDEQVKSLGEVITKLKTIVESRVTPGSALPRDPLGADVFERISSVAYSSDINQIIFTLREMNQNVASFSGYSPLIKKLRDWRYYLDTVQIEDWDKVNEEKRKKLYKKIENVQGHLEATIAPYLEQPLDNQP